MSQDHAGIAMTEWHERLFKAALDYRCAILPIEAQKAWLKLEEVALSLPVSPASHPQQPSGWKLVPAEVTPEWFNAAAERGIRIGTMKSAIADVLACAPAPPAEQQEGDYYAIHKLDLLHIMSAAIGAPYSSVEDGAERLRLKTIRKLYEQQEGGEALRERVRDAIATSLGGAYDCLRVWSAWQIGTMGPDDFSLVAEDSDRLDEITDAAIAAMTRGRR